MQIQEKDNCDEDEIIRLDEVLNRNIKSNFKGKR